MMAASITDKIFSDYFSWRGACERGENPKPDDSCLELCLKMRKFGRKFKAEVSDFYLLVLGDLSTLSFHTHGETRKLIYDVAEGIFMNGMVTWGRIISFVCFGGILYMKCSGEKPDLVPIVSYWMRHYAKDNLETWICNQGGWSTFNESMSSYDTRENWPQICVK